jgi:pimeloyl-ACP methyl ester carboxylesterase
MAETTVTPTELGEVTLTVSRNAEFPDAPAVVLLHGFGGIGYSWRDEIPVLANGGYRVLAPDQRGHGWSSAPDGGAADLATLAADVIALLDHDGVDNAALVGQGWGALVAGWLALRHPQRVSQLIMLDAELDTMVPDSDAASLEADPISAIQSIAGSLPMGEFENYFRAYARSGFAFPIQCAQNAVADWQTHVGTEPGATAFAMAAHVKASTDDWLSHLTGLRSDND